MHPISRLVLAATLAFPPALAHAGTSSVASGAWSAPSTWNNSTPVNLSPVGVLNGATVTFAAGSAWTGGEHPQGLLVGDNGTYAAQAGLAGSGSGTLLVQGGALASAFVGVGFGANGAVTQTAGTVSTQEIVLGKDSSTGTYTLVGGSVSIARLLRFGVFGGGTGVFNHDAGLAEIASVTAWTNVTGLYRLRGGTLRALGDLSFTGTGANIALEISGDQGNVTVDTNGRNITAVTNNVFSNPAATLNKTGAGTLLFSGSQLQIQNGALRVSQGTLETHSSLVIGQNGGQATLELSGGTIRFGYPQAANFIVGLAGGTGSVVQTGGILQTASQTYALGWGGTGSHHLQSGTVNLGTGTAYVGLGAGGAGELRIGGGSFSAGSLQLAAAGAASGTLRLEGGSLAVAGSLALGPGSALLLDGASAGSAALIWSSGARVRFGGTASSFHRLNLNSASTLSIPSGTDLELTAPATTPAVGSRHFLLNNTGSGALSGRFSSVNGRSFPLEEASAFELNGVYYRIGYTGNSSANTFTGGNDLVLETVAAPPNRAALFSNFDGQSLAPWSAQDWSGVSPAKISAVTSAQNALSGARSARVTIASTHQPATAEPWHLVFTTQVPVTAGRHYRGSVTLRADRELSMELLVQRADAPYSTFAFQRLTIGTTPTTLDFGGTATFTTVPGDASSSGRIVFALGKAPANSKIWLDNISFTEAPRAAATATVAVNFAQDLAVPSLSGFLLGLDVNSPVTGNPPANVVTPLRPAFWRIRGEWASRVAGYGATPIIVCSEGFYPPAPTPWSDNYVTWRAHVTALAQTHGTSAVYDIWNEPDYGIFFMDWPDATFERFLETFRQAHDAIRAVAPGAIISGPSLGASYSPTQLRRFMDFCLQQNLTVQVLSLHMLDREDADLPRVRTDIAKVRADFIDAPLYDAVGVQQIHVNEYAAPGDQSYRPGSILAFLRSLETAGVAAACRSCWDHPNAPGVNTGFDGSIDGLLTHDTFQPRAVWWAHRWYADGAAHRVSASANNADLVVFASDQTTAPDTAQILLASHGSGGAARPLQTVTLQLSNLTALPFVVPGATQILARVERIAFAGLGTAAVPQPEVVDDQRLLQITSGTATLILDSVEPYDVLRVTLHPANSPPTLAQSSPVPVTMDEDGQPGAWTAPELAASDPDGDPLVWTLAAPPAHGTATVSGEGPAPAILHYAPPTNFEGEDAFIARVSDGRGGLADATIAVTVVSDGIPASWENEYGVSRAGDDPDGDGFSNLAEHRFGTAPDSAASRFRLDLAPVSTPDGRAIELRFPSVNGRTYVIETSPDLAPASWSALATLPGTDADLTHLAPIGEGARRFFRVRVQLPNS